MQNIEQSLKVERKSMSRDSNFSHFLPTLLCQVSIGGWWMQKWRNAKMIENYISTDVQSMQNIAKNVNALFCHCLTCGQNVNLGNWISQASWKIQTKQSIPIINSPLILLSAELVLKNCLLISLLVKRRQSATPSYLMLAGQPPRTD